MLAILAILLPMLLPAYLTLPDRDGDGYSDVRELVTGCDPFDHTSRPYCLPGADVPGSCSSSIPGAELEPC